MSQLLLSIKCEVTEVYQHAGALAKERIAHFESRYDEIVQAVSTPIPCTPPQATGPDQTIVTEEPAGSTRQAQG